MCRCVGDVSIFMYIDRRIWWKCVGVLRSVKIFVCYIVLYSNEFAYNLTVSTICVAWVCLFLTCNRFTS